ncbi:MAG: zinc metallopeptidase [Muribaculaceae bacterium]|nr:zinc metallopeptidase [Muribaculaceae bacterium]MBQ7212641.1 zinc metallopeptidase [Muribaculaceae bacterium]
MIIGYVIFGLVALLSFIVQKSFQSKFKKFSQMALPNGMTGSQVAQMMLAQNGINDVNVVHTGGELTDHYNPANKTVNLSDVVYSQPTVAAAAVAAHECGHAVQHATAYAMLGLRSKLVPVVNIASKWMQWILLAGILLVQVFPYILLVGIILFATTTLFSLVTLPVEINASARALKWLDHAGITDAYTYPAAKSALKAAAYTYVVAALTSLATLVYYILIFLARRD